MARGWSIGPPGLATSDAPAGLGPAKEKYDERARQRDPRPPKGLPPEARNDEQDPTGTQAQDVAADAMREDSHTSSPLESTKPKSTGYDPAPDSKADLVDEMRRMEGDGRIDMSAFAGEPNHDDEPGTYGGETTDDDDAEFLTADGEALTEEGDDDLSGDDDELASLEELLGDLEIPEDEQPDEVAPLPDDDATPGGADKEE